MNYIIYMLPSNILFLSAVFPLPLCTGGSSAAKQPCVIYLFIYMMVSFLSLRGHGQFSSHSVLHGGVLHTKTRGEHVSGNMTFKV